MSENAQATAEELGRPRIPAKNSRKPRYLQIAELLREEILQGAHSVGSHLPTESELCKRFLISRYTVREALRHVEEMGLVSRRRGSGTMVRSAEPLMQYHQAVRSVDDLLQYSEATGFKLVHSERVAADPLLAGWLDTRVGVECMRLHGIRYQRRSTRPFSISDVYRRATWQGLPHGYVRIEDAFRSLLELQDLPRIDRLDQSLSAVALNEEQAQELEVAAGSPALRSLRRYFDSRGRLFMAAVSLHPGADFSYFSRYRRSDLTNSA